ncbi:hypothetical protein ACIOEX_23245 [Streptomyces sp. NPDC087850]|uniref:hypothetical protein n=1 Tax=unclassified Streptomyces TaxID=2593676 RepID=UPI0038042B11
MTTAHTDEDPADNWTAVVRARLALGRLLPLGGADDGAWLAERAATAELRRAGAGVAGVALGALRISASGADAEPADGGGAVHVPAPPSALPRVPLRIEAEFTASAALPGERSGERSGELSGEPLPAVAQRLRAALSGCAADRLGLAVEEVDLRVTALVERGSGNSSAPAGPVDVRAAAAVEGEAARLAASVPGVAYLTETLGSAVTGTSGRVRVELATAAGHRPLEVTRAVRAKLTGSLPGAPSVAVLVTAVEAASRHRGAATSAPVG